MKRILISSRWRLTSALLGVICLGAYGCSSEDPSDAMMSAEEALEAAQAEVEAIKGKVEAAQAEAESAVAEAEAEVAAVEAEAEVAAVEAKALVAVAEKNPAPEVAAALTLKGASSEDEARALIDKAYDAAYELADGAYDKVYERADSAYDKVYEQADGAYDKVYEEADTAYDRIVDQISDDLPIAEQMAARSSAMKARTESVGAAMKLRTTLIGEASRERSRLISEASKVRTKAIQRASELRRQQLEALRSGGVAALAAKGVEPAALPTGGEDKVAIEAEPALGADAAVLAAAEPSVVGDLGSDALPPRAELADKYVSCKVAGSAALIEREERRDQLGLSDTSPLVLEVSCSGSSVRKLEVFASEKDALKLFDIGEGTGLTVQLKGVDNAPFGGRLHALDEVRVPWLPALPQSPREAPGFAEADAAYRAAVKALAAETAKKESELAKAQVKAVSLVPTTHKKELAEMNKQHAEFKRDKNSEVNERVREMAEEIREELSGCAGEYGEDARDCRADVRETKRDHAEEIRELRAEVKDAIKEADKEHKVAIADYKATLPDMLQEARVAGSRAIMALKAEQQQKLAELDRVRANRVGGAAKHFPLIAQTIQALCAQRGVPVPDEVAKRIAEAGDDAGTSGGFAEAYPARCGGLDMGEHVEIAGDPGWCVPSDPGRVLIKGGESFQGCSDSYDDTDACAVLGKPDKRLGESLDASDSERKAKIAETRSTIYYAELSACQGELTETSGQFSLACDLRDEALFMTSPPTVKRTQQCETDRPERCGGTCSDDGDCDEILCGCPESRCVFFRCTGCPAERLCEEPEFNVNVAPYKAGRALKGEDRDLAREISVGESDYRAIVGFKVSSAWRKIFMGRECDEDYDGRRVCEAVLEHSEGFRAKVAPVFSGYVHCPDGRCAGGQAASLALKTGSFSLTLENEGHSAVVTCGATCKASSKR